MKLNLEINLIKMSDKIKDINDESLKNQNFDTFIFDKSKSNDKEFVFLSKSKILEMYLYGFAYIIIGYIILQLIDKMEEPAKIIQILLSAYFLSVIAAAIGLIAIPFITIKKIIFEKDEINNKFTIIEVNVIGIKNVILDIKNVKKIINKIDTKNNYITFRNGNIIEQSIILKINSTDVERIKLTEEFLMQFVENTNNNIELTKL